MADQVINKRYILHEKLGAGGMGMVYRATDKLTRRTVALKQVHGDTGIAQNDQQGFDRRLALAQEFQTLASLRHPNIISVLDYGFDEDRYPYFTMDLLDKPRHIIEIAWRTQSLSMKISLLVETLQALAYLHRRGIIHRDLKPGNILFTNGQVKVLDFGLSRAHEYSDAVVGTPAYIAPELLRGEKPTPASDLYSLGVIAYEMFVGRHPFNTTNIAELISDVLDAPPDLSGLTIDSDNTVLFEAETLVDVDLSTADISSPNNTEVITRTDYTDETMEITRAGLSLSPGFHGLDQGACVNPSNTLGQIIERLLSKSPWQRYADASAVIRDLSGIIGIPMSVDDELTRESFLQAASFVGRECELSALSTGLADVCEGKGSTWLVSGESGIGKSRLLDELRIRALVDGVLVLRGYASGSGAPYQMWREVLRYLALSHDLDETDAGTLKRVLPDLEEVLERDVPDIAEIDPEQEHTRLLATMSGLFRRHTQPTLIILEDLQWARSETLKMLEQVHTLLDGLPIMAACTWRTDETAALPISLPGAHHLQLERLNNKEIAELAESMLGVIGRQTRVRELLQRETEGNVYFVVEVVRALAEEAGGLDLIGSAPLPDHVFTGGVNRMVQRRLNRVLPEHQPLLRVAATVGRQIDLHLLNAINADHDLEPWLNSCAEAAVLEVKEQHWQFSHDKLREGLLNSLDPSIRAQMHGLVAETIEHVYANEIQYVITLMEHWQLAGNHKRASYYAALAGEQFFQFSAYQDAIHYFEHSLLLIEDLEDALVPDKPQRIAAVKCALARTMMRLSQYDKAARLAHEALAQIAAPPVNRHLEAEALSVLGFTAFYQGKLTLAVPYLTESLALFRRANDIAGLADALRGLARIALRQGEVGEAAHYLQESLFHSRQISSHLRVANALRDLGNVVVLQNRHAEAIRYLEESLALCREMGNREGTMGALLNLGQVALSKGEYGVASEHYAESLVICREIGDRRAAAEALNNLGYTALLLHNYSTANDYLEESLSIFREIGFPWGVVNTLINLGHVARAVQDSLQAAHYFYDALPLSMELGAQPMMLEIMVGIAGVKLDDGQYDEAAELLGLPLNHPATNAEIISMADSILSTLRDRLPAEVIESVLERGKRYYLNQIVERLLQQTHV